MRRINKIVIHCSATPEGRDIGAAEIREWHKAKGWSDIGYHYVVRLDGTLEKGRSENYPGAHVAGHNADSIGIVYIGGLAKDGKTPKDTRTREQIAMLRLIVKNLRRQYPNAEVFGHRDLSPDKDRDGKVEKHEWMKACPSFDVRTEL